MKAAESLKIDDVEISAHGFVVGFCGRVEK